MKKLSIAILVSMLMLANRNLCLCQVNKHLETINSIMDYIVKNYSFSGTVLITADGKSVYNKSFGYANTELAIPNNLNTAYDIASSIKPLVAAGVLKLHEEEKLGIDDDIAKYFEKLPNNGIKIKHLLSHTSGLPEYTHNPGFENFAKNKMKADSGYVVSNKDLIEWLSGNSRVEFNPGEKYRYCNGNYALLASIVEKVTGLAFYDFMRKYVIKPAGMTSSKFYDELEDYKTSERSLGYERTKEGKYVPFFSHHLVRGMQGDGGLYSTAPDMQRFLTSFLEGKLVSKGMVSEAIAPYRFNSGGTGLYGLGWIIRGEGYQGRPLTIKHGGRWEGFLNAFAYEPQSHISIIILTNNSMYPPTIGELEKAFSDALAGKEPILPKFPIIDTVSQTLYLKGADSAIELFRNLTSKSPSKYFIDENEMNYLALSLVWENRKEDAVKILELNWQVFPNQSNNYDSIGDTYKELGNLEKAKEAYLKALSLDSKRESTRKKLDHIEKK